MAYVLYCEYFIDFGICMWRMLALRACCRDCVVVFVAAAERRHTLGRSLVVLFFCYAVTHDVRSCFRSLWPTSTQKQTFRWSILLPSTFRRTQQWCKTYHHRMNKNILLQNVSRFHHIIYSCTRPIEIWIPCKKKIQISISFVSANMLSGWLAQHDTRPLGK